MHYTNDGTNKEIKSWIIGLLGKGIGTFKRFEDF